MATEWLSPLLKIQMPDPFDDEYLLGDRPELPIELYKQPSLTTAQPQTTDGDPSHINTLTDYIARENERLASLKKQERIKHIRRAREAGQFVFRHKVAAITGAAAVVGVAVGGRLLRKR